MSETEASTVKVIGFTVEGESPKSVERPPKISVHTGSPLPVSIPPLFNRTPRGQTQEPPHQDHPSKPELPETTSTQSSKFDGSQNTPIFQLEDRESDAKPSHDNFQKPRQSLEKKEARQKPKPAKESLQTRDTGQSSASVKETKQKKNETKIVQQKKPKAKKEKTPPVATPSLPCVSFFDHLDAFKPFDVAAMMRRPEAQTLDDRFLRFCADYADGQLSESASCKAMLECFICSLEWLRNDAGVFYSREAINFFNHRIGFLIDCRSLNVAMRNVIRGMKVSVTKLPSGIPLEDGKEAVRKLLRSTIEDKVDVLDIVAKEAEALIKDDDMILTYAASDTILAVLRHAWQKSKRFRVLIVDARPALDGRQLLDGLTSIGVPCQYCLLHALGFVLKGVSKVMIGTSAVLSNGMAVGRTGSAMIATMAQALHVPVVVCCQTLKFHERVQLDSFSHNELGDARRLLTPDGLIKGEVPNLSLLSLKYDLMPAECISVIVSELGFVPQGNVPAILREQANERESVASV